MLAFCFQQIKTVNIYGLANLCYADQYFSSNKKMQLFFQLTEYKYPIVDLKS